VDDQQSLWDDPVSCTICRDAGWVYDERIAATRMCVCRSERLPAPDTNPDAPAGIDGQDDVIRLNHQQAAVWVVMKDGEWHTLAGISERTGYPEASVSARFRDLRKQKYGGHVVERQSAGGGLFLYRLIPSDKEMR